MGPDPDDGCKFHAGRKSATFCYTADMLIRGLLSIVFWIWVALATCMFTMLVGIAALLTGWMDHTRWLPQQLTALWARAIVLVNPAWRLTVEGRQHLPTSGAYVLVSNHASLADIIVLYHLPSPFKWLAKESLFRIPLLGWSMAWAGNIPLVREEQRSIRASFNGALACLQMGVPVMVFPEGTRSRTGRLGAFKRGAFGLAIRAGVPVVPIAVTGTRDVVIPGTWILRPARRIHIRIFPPVVCAQDGPEEADRLRDRVRALIAGALPDTVAT